MKLNVGTIDRILRLLLGLGIVSLVFVGPQTQLGWVGLLFVATAVMSFCPIYAALGLSTKKSSD